MYSVTLVVKCIGVLEKSQMVLDLGFLFWLHGLTFGCLAWACRVLFFISSSGAGFTGSMGSGVIPIFTHDASFEESGVNEKCSSSGKRAVIRKEKS